MPEQHEEGERAPSCAERYARECVLELSRSAEARRVEGSLQEADGLTVLGLVLPTPADSLPGGLSECAVDCLRLLAVVKEPLSAERIRKELDRRDIGVYSIATVKRHLARLRRLQIVSNYPKRPRGYYLPEAQPILR